MVERNLACVQDLLVYVLLESTANSQCRTRFWNTSERSSVQVGCARETCLFSFLKDACDQMADTREDVACGKEVLSKVVAESSKVSATGNSASKPRADSKKDTEVVVFAGAKCESCQGTAARFASSVANASFSKCFRSAHFA